MNVWCKFHCEPSRGRPEGPRTGPTWPQPNKNTDGKASIVRVAALCQGILTFKRGRKWTILGVWAAPGAAQTPKVADAKNNEFVASICRHHSVQHYGTGTRNTSVESLQLSIIHPPPRPSSPICDTNIPRPGLTDKKQKRDQGLQLLPLPDIAAENTR